MSTPPALRAHILNQLHSGAWFTNERLPTERAFANEFGISRNAVRAVLQALRSEGLLRQRVGSGTYVTPEAAAKVESLASYEASRAVSPAELMEARLALEPSIIDMVIGNATEADFLAMDACCDRAETAETVEQFEHWDGRLHEAISQAAHNGFVSTVFALMNQARARGEWGMLKKRSLTPERRLAYQHEHRLLVQALRDRDGQQARALATGHLLHVRKNLLNY